MEPNYLKFCISSKHDYNWAVNAILSEKASTSKWELFILEQSRRNSIERAQEEVDAL